MQQPPNPVIPDRNGPAGLRRDAVPAACRKPEQGRQPLLVSTGASLRAVEPGEQAMGLQVAQDSVLRLLELLTDPGVQGAQVRLAEQGHLALDVA